MGRQYAKKYLAALSDNIGGGSITGIVPRVFCVSEG